MFIGSSVVLMNKLIDLLDQVNDNALVIKFSSTKYPIYQAVAFTPKESNFCNSSNYGNRIHWT